MASKSVATIILERLEHRLDKMDTKLDRIEKQTTLTNGRVSVLEKKGDTIDRIQDLIKDRLTALEEEQKVLSALRSQENKFKQTNKGDIRYWTEIGLQVAPWIVTAILFFSTLIR